MEALETEYKSKKETIEAERAELSKLSDIEHRENAVLEAEATWMQNAPRSKAATIAEIRADEQHIRENEYQALCASLGRKAEAQRTALASELEDKRATTEGRIGKSPCTSCRSRNCRTG